jgi:hypothetical protein
MDLSRMPYDNSLIIFVGESGSTSSHQTKMSKILVRASTERRQCDRGVATWGGEKPINVFLTVVVSQPNSANESCQLRVMTTCDDADRFLCSSICHPDLDAGICDSDGLDKREVGRSDRSPYLVSSTDSTRGRPRRCITKSK